MQRRIIHPVLVLLFSVLLACGPTVAPQAGTAQPGPHQASLEAYFSALANAGRFSGSVLVVEHGETILRAGYGLADIEHQVANTATTRYRISSLTKAFTARAILELQQQGRLQVGDSICVYLTNCPDTWQPVSLHHLLSHTSGIPDYLSADGYWDLQGPVASSLDQLIAAFIDLPLKFPPGEQFAYSNSGYLLLGAVIARLHAPDLPPEQAYMDLLRSTIFEPLAMADTGSIACATIIPQMADGYQSLDQVARYCDGSNLFAIGELYSTIDDLYRWERGLNDPALTPGAIRDSLFRPYTYSPHFNAQYGYGWFLDRPDGVARIWHSGATPGFRSYIAFYPELDITVIVLSNLERTPLGEIARAVGAIVLDAVPQ